MSEVRRRPKDRKAQIARIAAEAFSELGFHSVSMDDIATRVGVSATALYRHSPGKYALFRDAVFALSDQLVEVTAFADTAPEHLGEVGPRARLDRLVAALVEVSIVSRSSGGVYRWGDHYLLEEDAQALREQVKLVNLRLQQPLREMRPELNSRERWALSVSVLSIIGSIVDHRTRLSAGRIHQLFARLTGAIWQLEPPTGNVVAESPVSARPVDAGRYEAVLREAMTLFHTRGYRETTVEEIADAVGMPTSGIYRYFPGKADILAALFRRSADRLASDTGAVLATSPDPRIALERLIECYVTRSFDSPEIDYLYFTERTHVLPSDAVLMHNMQRATVDTWVRLVRAVHPDLSDRDARFVVQAAFALVVDLGRMTRYENTTTVRDGVGAMMRTVLLAPAGAAFVANEA
jgi:AcrR family transcriptional regulator